MSSNYVDPRRDEWITKIQPALKRPPLQVLVGIPYLRGDWLSSLRSRVSAAAEEFQKIVEHSGIVVNEPIGVLAHLNLGPAYAMEGDIFHKPSCFTGQANVAVPSSVTGRR